MNVLFLTHKTGMFFSNKTLTPKHCDANLVYLFKCHGCDAQYVGQSGRHLKTRLAKHRQTSRNSEIKDHNLICSNRTAMLNMEEFKILAKSFPSHRQRLIRETLEIKSINGLINIQRQQICTILKLFQH